MAAVEPVTIPEEYVDEWGGDTRPSAYWELDGQVVPPDQLEDAMAPTMVVRAHALGRCQWDLAAHLQGHEAEEFPPAILRAFRAGHVAEPVVLERLYGAEMKWVRHEGAAQAQGELRCGGNRVVRYHPDDVAVSNLDGVLRIVEVKALSADNFRKAHIHGPHTLGYGYDWQLSAQMIALGLSAVYVLCEKPDGKDPFDPETYRNANLAMRYVDKPERSRAEIIRRVKEIYDVAVGEDLTTSGRPCDDPKQWPCPFRSIRPQPEGDVVPDVPDDRIADFRLLTKKYLAAKAKVDKASEDRDGVRDQLLALADELGMDRMGHDGTKVTISRSTPVLVDRKKLEADGLLGNYSTLGQERVSVRVT